MRNRTVLITLGLLLLLGGIAMGYMLNASPSSPSITTVPTVSQQTTVSPEQQMTGQPSPTPSLSMSPTQEANIRVSVPRIGSTVGRNFSVTGQARVFENVFQIRVTHTPSGQVLYNKPADSNAPDTGVFGNFSVPISLTQTTLKSGDALVLEVFQFSAKDGSESDKVTVPLVFKE